MNIKDEKLLKGFSSFLNEYDYDKCIDEELMALLVDNKLPKHEKNRLLKHISVCKDCYDRYVLLKELKSNSKRLSKNTIIKIAVVFLVFSISIFYYFQYKSLKKEDMTLPFSKESVKKEMKQEKLGLKTHKKRLASRKPSLVKKSFDKGEKNINEENIEEYYNRMEKELPVGGVVGIDNQNDELFEELKVFKNKKASLNSSKFINKGLRIKNPDVLNVKLKSCKNRVYKVRFYVSSKGRVLKLKGIDEDDCFRSIKNILIRILFYPYKENNKPIDVNFYLKVEINKKIKILN